MGKLQVLYKKIYIIALSVCAALLSFFYFATSYETVYNAFVIVLIFGLYEFLIFSFIKNWRLVRKREFIVSMLCGLVLAATSLIGVLTESNQGYVLGTLQGVIKSLLNLVLRIILFGGISLYLFCSLKARSDNSKETDSLNNTRLLIWSWIIISLSWLPYCVMHFPGRTGGGVYNQLLQFYGQDTLARNMSSIIYEGHYITNHHPVLLTCFYGIFFKIGNFLKNTNSAVFLLSCITLLISSFCMSYSLATIRKYISKKIFIILLVFVCLHPIFGMYSFASCKDNLYASCLLLFYTSILEIVFREGKPLSNKRFKWMVVGISVLIPFLKNQGLIVVVVSLIFLAIFRKNVRRFMIFNIATVILIYAVLFSHIIMPLAKIAPGGKQEALSVPFQQTALYVKRYGEELTQEELEIIDKVLPVDEIASLYDGRRADAVKFRYKQQASFEELIDYFVLWFKHFFKHPDVYFRAFFLLTDGYYYIDYNWATLDLDPGIGVMGASTPQWVVDF